MQPPPNPEETLPRCSNTKNCCGQVDSGSTRQQKLGHRSVLGSALLAEPAPGIQATGTSEREALFDAFRRGEVATPCVSKVANFIGGLPRYRFQISPRQEAQLGRILITSYWQRTDTTVLAVVTV